MEDKLKIDFTDNQQIVKEKRARKKRTPKMKIEEEKEQVIVDNDTAQTDNILESNIPESISPPIPTIVTPTPDVPLRESFFKRLFKKKIKPIPHPIKKPIPIKKAITEYSDLEFSDMKRCPKCDFKLKKSRVYEIDENLVQYLKCSDIKCDFYKKIEIKN